MLLFTKRPFLTFFCVCTTSLEKGLVLARSTLLLFSPKKCFNFSTKEKKRCLDFYVIYIHERRGVWHLGGRGRGRVFVLPWVENVSTNDVLVLDSVTSSPCGVEATRWLPRWLCGSSQPQQVGRPHRRLHWGCEWGARRSTHTFSVQPRPCVEIFASPLRVSWDIFFTEWDGRTLPMYSCLLFHFSLCSQHRKCVSAFCSLPEHSGLNFFSAAFF